MDDHVEEHGKPRGTIAIVTAFMIATIAVWLFTYYLIWHRS